MPSKKKKGDEGDQEPMAVDEIAVPFNLNAAAASATGSAAAAAAAAAAAHGAPATPENVPHGDILKLVKHLCDQHNIQVGKIDQLSKTLGELSVNQANTATHVVGVEKRLDCLDSRIIKLEEYMFPAEQVSMGTALPSAGSNSSHPPHAWGSKERGSSSFPPALPTSFLVGAPKAFSHWDRDVNPTILCANTNQHKVSLDAVGMLSRTFLNLSIYQKINLRLLFLKLYTFYN